LNAASSIPRPSSLPTMFGSAHLTHSELPGVMVTPEMVPLMVARLLALLPSSTRAVAAAVLLMEVPCRVATEVQVPVVKLVASVEYEKYRVALAPAVALARRHCSST